VSEGAVRPDAQVDTRGLECPIPVFHARDAMFDLPPGALVEVLADDPQAPSDLEHWCRRNGHAVLAIDPDGRGFKILIRRGADVERPATRRSSNGNLPF